MAKKTVIEGSDNVRASQLSELFRQIDGKILIKKHLDAFLEHRNPFLKFIPELWISKKANDIQSFETACVAIGRFCSGETYRLFSELKSKFIPKSGIVDYACVSPKDLGFIQPASYKELETVAFEYGLELCTIADIAELFSISDAGVFKRIPRVSFATGFVTDKSPDRHAWKLFYFDTDTNRLCTQNDAHEVYYEGEFIFRISQKK